MIIQEMYPYDLLLAILKSNTQRPGSGELMKIISVLGSCAYFRLSTVILDTGRACMPSTRGGIVVTKKSSLIYYERKILFIN
jgi:hypothetical protein